VKAYGRLLVTFAIAALVVAAHAVRPPRAAAASASSDRPGRARFEQAEVKFNLGRFEDAVADYQAAYEVEPLPAFLFNIGQCYRNMGDYERAEFYFRRYVALDPRSPNRPAAERLIAEMDRLAERQPAVATLPAVTSLASDSGAAAPAPFAPSLRQSAKPDAPPPLYRRPWFWVGAGVAAAGAIAAAVVVSRDDAQPSLRPIDVR
jgi:tetratricopeptide (TPR) repeat protein